MKQLIPILMICIIFTTPMGITADTFTGSGNSTTDTFESTKYTKITWSYTPENEYDLFSAFIYKEGDSIYSANFDGTDDTTYLYESGTFYFDVSSANIASWTITTLETDGEYLSNGDKITGSQNKVSKLFVSTSKVTFTWNYTPENEYDLFNVFVYKVDSNIYADTFSGDSGSSTLYGIGTYYLDISAANIVNYEITIDISQDASQSSTTSDTSTSQNQNTSTNSGDDDSLGTTTTPILIIPLLAAFWLGSVMRKIRKRSL